MVIEPTPLNASDASIYVTSLAEVLCGALLVALTMAIHGVGVVVTLRASGALRRRRGGRGTGAARGRRVRRLPAETSPAQTEAAVTWRA